MLAECEDPTAVAGLLRVVLRPQARERREARHSRRVTVPAPRAAAAAVAAAPAAAAAAAAAALS